MNKIKVYALSDSELVYSAVMSVEWSGFSTLTLTQYERTFLSEIWKVWSKYNSITWKQRKLLRELILKIGEELERRQLLAEAKEEMI